MAIEEQVYTQKVGNCENDDAVFDLKIFNSIEIYQF